MGSNKNAETREARQARYEEALAAAKKEWRLDAQWLFEHSWNEFRTLSFTELQAMDQYLQEMAANAQGVTDHFKKYVNSYLEEGEGADYLKGSVSQMVRSMVAREVLEIRLHAIKELLDMKAMVSLHVPEWQKLSEDERTNIGASGWRTVLEGLTLPEPVKERRLWPELKRLERDQWIYSRFNELTHQGETDERARGLIEDELKPLEADRGWQPIKPDMIRKVIDEIKKTDANGD